MESNNTNAITKKVQLAVDHIEQGKLLEAESLLEQALQPLPNNISILNLLGVVQHKRGNHEKSRDTFEKSLAIDLTNKEIASNLKNVRLTLMQKQINRAYIEYSLRKYPLLNSFIEKFRKEYLNAKVTNAPVAKRIREQQFAAPIQDDKQEILFLSFNPRVDMAKKADALKQTGKYRVRSLCFKATSDVLDGFFSQYFDEVMTYTNLADLLYFLLALKPDVIIARPKSNIAALAIIFSGSPVVFNLYDIECVAVAEEHKDNKYQDPLTIEAEKFCFENADGIIHKGSEDEIDKYISPKYKIKAPILHFYPCCWERYFAPENTQKLSGKDGVPHLVYTGLIAPPSADKKTTGQGQFTTMIGPITKQQIHLHLYYNPETGVNDAYYKEYFDLAGNNPYFHFHSPLAYDRLCNEAATYDYGFIVHDTRGAIWSEIQYNISMANKIFTYLEAGIPIIAGNNNKAIADFVTEQRVGIVVDPTDLSGLSEILNRVDYQELRLNVLRARNKYSLEKNIPRLVGLMNQAKAFKENRINQIRKVENEAYRLEKYFERTFSET